MTDALVIRPARAEERAALEDLQRRASLVHPDYREELLAHPDAIDLPAALIAAGRVLVAEDGNGVAGFAAWTDGPGEAALDGLFVEPACWRGGIGRALVDAAAAAARAAGFERLAVVANPNALAFYRRCGFVAAGATRTRFGPAPVMTRALVQVGAGSRGRLRADCAGDGTAAQKGGKP